MSNTLTNVAPLLLAQGLMALRENAVMPRLVNSDYSSLAAEKGTPITIPIPSTIAVQDVTPGAYSNATGDIAPTKVTLTLDQWKEAPFYLTDKDVADSMSGVIPMQASEAVKSLANNVDNYILALYTGIYGYTGTAGTTPFASATTDSNQARKVLNNQLAPLSDRRFVIDPDCEAKALDLRAFQDYSFAGPGAVIEDGLLKNKLGFSWFMDQNIPTHTTVVSGTNLIDQSDVEVGDVAVHMDGLGVVLTVGDIFTVAGDTQTYTVATCSTLTGSDADVTFAPGAKVAWADSAAVTLKETHVVNLAFHRDCFALATRPLIDTTDGLGNIIVSATDTVSGLSLRLEISREHKRTRFSYDILYGASLARAELGCRLAG